MMTKQKATMAERLNIGGDTRELKLGCTFNSKNATAFHTIKYDFKPASVDINRVAAVDVGSSNQVTVTVPNLVSSGVPHTVYKGNHRKYTKECLIIFDKKTGDMTLEKLNHNIQVKKTRSETTNKISAVPLKIENSTVRVSSKTKVSTGSRKNLIIDFKPRNSPMQQSSPSGPVHKSPQSAPAWNANNAQATLPSIPMIFDDDDSMFGIGSCTGLNTTCGPSTNSGLSSIAAPGQPFANELHASNQSQSQTKQSKQNHNQQQTQKINKYQKYQQQYQQQWQPQFNQQQQHLHQNHSQYQQCPQQTNTRLYTKTSTAVIYSSDSNNIKPININNRNASPQQPASQCLSNTPPSALEQEIGVLSSSDSSSDSDSSASNSVSDSEGSNDDVQHQPQNVQTFPHLRQESIIMPTSSVQQPSNYANESFSNDLLHDDLQLSESNSSDTSD